MAAILLKNLNSRFFQVCRTFVKIGELKISHSNTQHPRIFPKIRSRHETQDSGPCQKMRICVCITNQGQIPISKYIAIKQQPDCQGKINILLGLEQFRETPFGPVL
jgi:hypothetical protein